MFDYYELDIIPIILNRFKVKNIIISGTSDKETIKQILEYCNTSSSSYIAIDSLDDSDEDIIKEHTLDVLPYFNDYEAIFLNDDPNWYTIYNELKIIKQNNAEFPLVFIGNNIFPHKRRDSYIDPNIIPEEFVNDCSQYFNYKNILIEDGFFHAIDENTPKNGVLTAIEDFISENPSIGIMNIKLLNGTTILYPKNSISQIRLGRLSEEIEGHDLDYDRLSDSVVENQLLTNYMAKLDISKSTIETINEFRTDIAEKEKIIDNYEDQIRLHDNELSYKNSQIKGFDSKLSLKDSQIKNFESKLLNSENEITDLNNQLDSLRNTIEQKEKKELELNSKISNANSQIDSLKNTIEQKEKKESEIKYQLNKAKNQIKDNSDELNFKNNNIHFKDDQIRIKEKELKDKEIQFNSLKHRYTSQLAKLDNKEYCISCYKEEISNNQLEIQYLKNETILKKLLNPLAYAYLILKSNTRELSLNLKLYKALKNSKCFDIGYYLNNNADLQNSKWCKYFSPELHYVCNGFNEERKFNKKYFNRNSKKELLDYINKCQ
ncbi:hypothetical protein [Methanobrevibacter sp.]|uniref:hypothetical protein n=1 Tax=Methanobrevibacter sp. TaxID=66852 RepID=UPI0038639439